MSPQEITNMPSRFGDCVKVSAGEKCFNLRRYTHRLPIVGVVERFDPERIACKKDPIFPTIPKNECKHSAHLIKHRFATIGIQMKQNFRVALRNKTSSLLFQFRTQLAVVVDLSVKNYGERSIFAEH